MTQPEQRTKNLLRRANKERSKYSRRLTFQFTEEQLVERVLDSIGRRNPGPVEKDINSPVAEQT